MSCNVYLYCMCVMTMYVYVLFHVAGVDILQKIPLHESIAESSDSGKPIVLAASKSRQAEAYRELAEHVVTFLNKQEINEE